MNGRERVLAMLDGKAVDCLPVMPITMMFAVDQIGKKYCEYATDYRVLADAQVLTAETFDFDHVSAIAETREAPDCGAVVEYFDDQPPSRVGKGLWKAGLKAHAVLRQTCGESTR